jgi:hypothetical protein
MQDRSTIPQELTAFARNHDATLKSTTSYFSDGEATQYPELEQFMRPNEEGLTFKGGYFSLTNADSVNRHEVVELVNILQRHSIRLTSLLLNGGYIDDAGVEALANFIKTSTTLKVLDIHYSRVSEKGMQYLIDALKVNTSLIQLNVRSNALTPILFQNMMELFDKYNFSVRQLCIVQRTSFPADWKPSVEDEIKLHDLIIRNARGYEEKKAARKLLCGIGRQELDRVIPFEMRFRIAQFSMFLQFPNMTEHRANLFLNKAKDDYDKATVSAIQYSI